MRLLPRIVAGLALASATLVMPVVAFVTAAQQATPGPAVDTNWVDTVLPAGVLAEDVPQTFGVFHVVWDAGATSRFAGGTLGVSITCVVDGQWGFRPDQEESVIRAGRAGEPEAAPAATETIVSAGDCAVLRQSVGRDERNAGDGPVERLVLMLIPDETPPPEGGPEPLEFGPLGYLYAGNWSRTPEGPIAPIRLVLERTTLEPGASRPETVAAGDALVIVTSGALSLTPEGGSPLVERAVSWTSEAPAPVAAGRETALEPTDTAQISEGTTAALMNDGDEPATWWLVSFTPVEEPAATPAA